MEVTAIGVIILPIGLAAAMFPNARPLLWLTIFFAPFFATAVVNVGHEVGIQPGYYFGTLFIIKSFLDKLIRYKFSFVKERVRYFLPFWAFLLIAMLSILAIPLYGPIDVKRPSGAVVPLELGGENFTQLLYLFYVIVLTTYIALSHLNRKDIEVALRVFLVSGIFVALWGWCQLGFHYAGLPYPDFLFNNSVSYSQNFDQFSRGLGIKRMTSVMSEPSMLARFLLIPMMISIYCVYQKGFLVSNKYAIVLVILFCLTLICTTSTTALLGLAGVICIFLAFMLWKTGHVGSGLSRLWRGMCLLSVMAILLLALFLGGLWYLGWSAEQLKLAVDVVLFDKLESQSGEARLSGAIYGLQLFLSHPLLGVGWGSNRTYDILTSILSTTGIIGALVFIFAHLILIARALTVLVRRLYHYASPLSAFCLEALTLALVARLFGKLMSEPNIVYLDHWILVGLLIAYLACLSIRTREYSVISRQQEDYST